MRKKLIAAIVAVAVCIAAAVGVIFFLENRPAGQPEEPTGTETSTVTSTPDETTQPAETTEPTEETVGLTFPTEDPNSVTPEDTFDEEDVVPPVTGEPATDQTEDPDANEAPEDIF